MRNRSHAICTQQLIVQEVCYISCSFAVFQCCDHICRNYQPATGEVQNTHTVFHLGQRFGVDHPFGIGRLGQMQGDIIAVRVNFIQRTGVAHAAGKSPGSIYRQIRVIAKHSHAQCFSRIGNQNTNGTQADNAQGFTGNFGANKCRFTFFHQFAYLLAFAFQAAGPINALGDFAGGQQQAAEHQFFYCICIGARGIEDHNALLAALFKRDIIDTSARSGNCQQLLGQLHVMHSGRTDQNGICLSQVGSDCIVLPKTVGTDGADFIQAMNSIHITDSPFQTVP